MDQDGDENLIDSAGGQQQPSTRAVAVDRTASSKRQRNDVGGSPSAPQAKKSANDADYKGKTMYKGSLKCSLAPIEGWLHDAGLFRPAPATQPKPDDTSFEREDQRSLLARGTQHRST